MIKIELTNYEAIALHGLLSSLSLLDSNTLTDDLKRQFISGFAQNAELRSVLTKVQQPLDDKAKRQKQVIEDWVGEGKGKVEAEELRHVGDRQFPVNLPGSEQEVYERMWGDRNA